MSNTFSKLPILEIIEWIEDDPNRVMWKVPDGDREIKNGAKLIVRESQTAMFMNEGQIADVFGSGTHLLNTRNVPLLTRLKGWKYGFESPFKADVYYFSVKQFVRSAERRVGKECVSMSRCRCWRNNKKKKK